MSKNITIPSLSILSAAWIASHSQHPTVTLDIEGGDIGGWYLVWDDPSFWDRSCPLDAVCEVSELDEWSALARQVFLPPDTTGTPITYKHRADLARAGHYEAMVGDDGRGWDAGDRTYCWQTLDQLVHALSFAVPADVLRAICDRWVASKAAQMQFAIERWATNTQTNASATAPTLITNGGWLRLTLSHLAAGVDPRVDEYNATTIAGIESELWSAYALGLADDLRDGGSDTDASTFAVDLPGIGRVTWWTEREHRGLSVGVCTILYRKENDRGPLIFSSATGVAEDVARWLMG